MSTVFNVLVVDDHEFYRKGLIIAIEDFPEVKVIGEASSGKDCLRTLQKELVNIILMDFRMPGMDGIITAKKVLKIKPSLKIIALIDFFEEGSIDDIIEAGFSGVVLKAIDAAELKHALHNVINGKTFYSPELMQILSGREKPASPSIRITKRENEIFQLVAKGLTNQQIADTLRVSIRTITNHRSNMHKKIGVNNSVQLISWGMKNNLIKNLC